MILKESSKDVPNINQDGTPLGESDTNSSLMKWIHPVLPYLTAAVKAEMVVIRAEDIDPPTEDVSKATYNTAGTVSTRLVRFCSFDFSCVTSPVDIILGSNRHLEQSIDALKKVIGEARALRSMLRIQRGGKGNIHEYYDEKIEVAKILLAFHAIASSSELREVCSEVSTLSVFSIYSLLEVGIEPD